MNVARYDQQYVLLVTSQLSEVTGGHIDLGVRPEPQELGAARETGRKTPDNTTAATLSVITNHPGGRK
jgi:hypothetical protein